MDLNEIQELIKFVAKAGVNEVEIEQKDFKLVIKSDYLAEKSNFKEEPTIVQQTIPMASMPTAQPVAQVEQPLLLKRFFNNGVKVAPKEGENSNTRPLKPK